MPHNFFITPSVGTSTLLRAVLRHRVWLLTAVILLSLFIINTEQGLASAWFTVTALVQTAPFLVLSIALAAYARASSADTLIAGIFTGSPRTMIIAAAVLGGLSPFCSCGVIPLIAALLVMGVPLSGVMAFWLASPVMDPAMFVLTSVWKFWQEATRRETFMLEALSTTLFLLKWLTLAFLLESLMPVFVPASLIASVLGGTGIAPILTATLVGVPAYLNGYAALPLVSGLIEQGMAAGAGFAFLVAGSVTSLPAAIAVFALVKRPVFILYVLFALIGTSRARTPGSLALGFHLHLTTQHTTTMFHWVAYLVR